MSHRLFCVLGLTACLFVASMQAAFACSCMPNPKFDFLRDNSIIADVTAVGLRIDTSNPSYSNRIVTYRVRTGWKGVDDGETLDVSYGSGGSSCDVGTPPKGANFRIYLHGLRDRLAVRMCGGGGGLTSAVQERDQLTAYRSEWQSLAATTRARPDAVEPYKRLARYLLEWGDPANALNALRQWSRLALLDAEPRIGEARILAQYGKLDDAELALAAAIKLDSDIIDVAEIRKSIETQRAQSSASFSAPSAYRQVTIDELKSLPLADRDLSKTDLHNFDIAHLDARHARLSSALLQVLKLPNADFSQSDLSAALISQSDLTAAKFIGANLKSVQIQWTKIEYADFTDANLSGAVLSGSMRGVRFNGANLSGAQFFSADVRGADFSGADLTGTTWRNVVSDCYTSARWLGAPSGLVVLGRWCPPWFADNDGVALSLSGVDLSGASFRHLSSKRQLSFDNSTLDGADFSNGMAPSILGGTTTNATFENVSGRLEAVGGDFSASWIRGPELTGVPEKFDSYGLILSATASSPKFDGAIIQRVNLVVRADSLADRAATKQGILTAKRVAHSRIMCQADSRPPHEEAVAPRSDVWSVWIEMLATARSLANLPTNVLDPQCKSAIETYLADGCQIGFKVVGARYSCPS